MGLTLQKTEGLQISYGAQRGLLSGALALTIAGSFQLADGTAAGQADSPFTAAPALGAGEVDAYFLSTGLQDGYGRELEFTAVKFLKVIADIANGADLVLGGGTWPGMFGDPSDTVHIRPGADMEWKLSDANGWPVVAGADELQITSVSAAAYQIIIVGVSSQLSIPAISALRPAIVGTPQVGSPCACTNGDWSGNPVFSYQWRRGSGTIPGATGATYTPVAADLGKAIARTTFADNIAGGANATSAPVTVAPAAAAAGVVLDFSDPATAALVGH